MYRIQRLYRYHPDKRYTIAIRLTLEEAQAHCREPETSSNTATSAAAQERTRVYGPWFDSYIEE